MIVAPRTPGRSRITVRGTRSSSSTDSSSRAGIRFRIQRYTPYITLSTRLSQIVSVAFHQMKAKYAIGTMRPTTPTECSSSSTISGGHFPVRRRSTNADTPYTIGHPSPTRRRRLPVKLAVMLETSPRQAMSASTANSGSVCSHARIASDRPWLMKNWAASAPQAMTKAESRIDGKVQSAAAADPSPAPMLAAAQAARTLLNMPSSLPSPKPGMITGS